MKRSPRPAAIPSKLSASIHQQLNSYALAAGAAGVGILALSQPAQAKIVYAAANVHIDRFVLNQLTFDHKTEFLLLATGDFNSTTIHGTSRLVARALGRNGVEGSGGNASALNAGSVIGPKQPFAGKLLESCYWADYGQCTGKWYFATPGPHYLGLKFYIHGEAHYGWARLTVNTPWDATLTGYAYETIANKPIVAGKTKGPNAASVQPASLGRLAKGAASISASHRREAAAGAQ